MAKIKHTKNELKAQREALTRYERFLPMLLLKKQQLQAEVQRATALIAEKKHEQAAAWDVLEGSVDLLSENVDLDSPLVLEGVESEQGNIAGVVIPIFKRLRVRRETPDLFRTPPWVEDALDQLEQLLRIRVELDILEEQRRLLAEELRTTSQRVNLFEKVKIPECRENIRIIKIFLGDEQTAAVARGKIAKRRSKG